MPAFNRRTLKLNELIVSKNGRIFIVVKAADTIINACANCALKDECRSTSDTKVLNYLFDFKGISCGYLLGMNVLQELKEGV